MVVFFFKWAWQGNKLGHFCRGALIIDGNLGPLWAVFAAFGCFGPFWAVLILKVFLPTNTHSLVTGPSWAVLSHLEPFWAILGHFGPFWTIFNGIFAKDHLSLMAMLLFQN